ncbi:MAG: Maf family protein [Chthoniobacterales bacterium]
MNTPEASPPEPPPYSDVLPMDLVLASTSPRRIELLSHLGHTFRIVPPGVEESSAGHLTPRELSLLNAKRKSHAVAAFEPTSIVIGADTVVAIAGETLGKPADLDEARSMIHKLSGRTHQVVTSVWITRLHPFHMVAFTEVSEVTFRSLDSHSILAYLEKIDPLDKAGAYAAQEYRDEIIESIQGSLDNVIGLPVESVALALTEF